MIFYCLAGLVVGAYIAVGIAGSLCNAPCIPLNMTDTTANSMTSSRSYSLATAVPSQPTALTSAWQSGLAMNVTSTSGFVGAVTSPTGLACAATCLDSEIH